MNRVSPKQHLYPHGATAPQLQPTTLCRPAGGCRKKPETYDQQSDSGARRRESGGNASPGLGEHNEEGFKGLGFELNEIERLSASGVIAKPAPPAQGSIGDQIAFNIL